MAETIDLAGMKVFVAMPTHTGIDPRVVTCLLATQNFMGQNNLPGVIRLSPLAAPVHQARSAMAKYFLESDCTHLFFIDSDMTWSADDFFRICALGQKFDVVGAAGVTKDAKRRFCVAGWDEDKDEEEFKIERYGCAKVAGLGLAFCIVTRRVILELAKKADLIRCGRDGEYMPDIFNWRKKAFKNSTTCYTVGEDIAFCEDARDLGYDVWLDPSITLGHIGTHVYARSLMETVDA